MEAVKSTDPFEALKKQLMRFRNPEEAREWVENWAETFPPSGNVLVIKMPLITHIACTDNKIKANRLIKVNGQTIYNGALNKFKRAIVVNNMHYYFDYNIPPEMLGMSLDKVKRIEYTFHTVINHGNISMRSGNKVWLKAKPGYEATWDIDNLAFIWIKTINDALVSAKVLKDDNASIMKKGRYQLKEVEHIDDLELEVRIYY